MSTPQPRSYTAGPGFILKFLKLPSSLPTQISPITTSAWLNQYCIPALLSKQGSVIKSACLYKAADPEYEKRYVIVCDVPELSLLVLGEMDAMLQGRVEGEQGGEMDMFMNMSVDTRVYSFVQDYTTLDYTGIRKEAAPTLLLALMQPSSGGEADLDRWYRQEHNQQMSEQPGWLRTRRFSLLGQHGRNDGEEELAFLAVHEFGEGHGLGVKVQAVEPVSAWTIKVVSEARGIDAAIYHLVEEQEEEEEGRRGQ